MGGVIVRGVGGFCGGEFGVELFDSLGAVVAVVFVFE